LFRITAEGVFGGIPFAVSVFEDW